MCHKLHNQILNSCLCAVLWAFLLVSLLSLVVASLQTMSYKQAMTQGLQNQRKSTITLFIQFFLLFFRTTVTIFISTGWIAPFFFDFSFFLIIFGGQFCMRKVIRIFTSFTYDRFFALHNWISTAWLNADNRPWKSNESGCIRIWKIKIFMKVGVELCRFYYNI